MLSTSPVILLLVAAAPAANTLATVGATSISSDQVRARLRAEQAARRPTTAEQVLEQLIDQELLAREGEAQGFGNRPAVKAAELAARKAAAVRLFLEKDLHPGVKIEDQQLRAMFHATTDTVQFKMIVTATEADGAKVLKRLQGGANFDEEARNSLDMRTAQKGGDSGLLVRTTVSPELQDLVFSAPLNELKGPVRLGSGFAVLKVTARRVADERELPARRAGLESHALKQARQAVVEHFTQQSRSKYKVSLDEEFLKSTGSSVEPSAEQAAHVIARVGNVGVRYQDVIDSQKATLGNLAGGHGSGFSVKSEFAWQVIDRTILEVEAAQRGHMDAPEVVAAGSAAARAAIAAEVSGALRAAAASQRPSQGDLEAWLRAHPAEFRVAAGRTCWQVVFKTRDEAAVALARIKGGERLEDLAATVSIDSATAARGGLLGRITDAQLASLESGGEKALAAGFRQTAPGSVSAPIQSRDGWHLVRCSAAEQARSATVAEAGPALVARVAADRGAEAVAERLRTLRLKTRISVDSAALARAAASWAKEAQR